MNDCNDDYLIDKMSLDRLVWYDVKFQFIHIIIRTNIHGCVSTCCVSVYLCTKSSRIVSNVSNEYLRSVGMPILLIIATWYVLQAISTIVIYQSIQYIPVYSLCRTYRYTYIFYT